MNCRYQSAFLYVILWSTVVACSQATTAAPLPGTLRDHIKDERFQTVTSIRGMPLGVRSELQTLFFSEKLDIAEIGAEFQGSAPGNPTLPIRRLVAAGCSYDHCLVYYELAGNPRVWRVALFHWAPEASRFEWGGTAPGGMKTFDEVKTAVLSGAIKGPTEVW